MCSKLSFILEGGDEDGHGMVWAGRGSVAETATVEYAECCT